MNKILKWLANLLLIFIIVVLASYFLLRVTNKIEIYNVKTGSMEAKIHVGDYILILKKSKYNVGDVVTYTSNNGFITHRIVRIEGNKVTTKGDANNTEDDVINAKIIVGKVIMSGGILNIVIKYKYLISGLVLSLYLFSCYFESVKEEEKNENKEDSLSEETKENEEHQEEKEEKKEQKNEELEGLIKEIKEELKTEDEKKEKGKSSKNRREVEKL